MTTPRRKPLLHASLALLLALALPACDSPTGAGTEEWTTPAQLPDGAVAPWPAQMIADGSGLYLLTIAHDRFDQWSNGSGVDPATSVETLALRTWRAGAWSNPETVAVGKAGARLYAEMAVDGTGRLHVIWGEARHIQNDAFYWDFAVRHRSRGAQGWTATETLHETIAGRGPPPGRVAAATGPDGRVHLVYEETPRQYDLAAGTVARFLVQDGGSWSAQRFRVGTHRFGGVTFHRVGGSELVALYNDTGDKVQRALRFRGGQWEAPVVTGGQMTTLNVTDGKGRIHAFWVDQRLLHSFSADGVAWSPAGEVVPPPYLWHQTVVADSRDRLHLLLGGGEVGGVPGFGHARFANGGWSAVETKPASVNFDGMIAAIDPEDRIHLVWRSGRGNQGRLVHSVYKAGP
jgi:hypothetical protein